MYRCVPRSTANCRLIDSFCACSYGLIVRRDKSFQYSLVHSIDSSLVTGQHVHFATVSKTNRRSTSGVRVNLPSGTSDVNGTFSLVNGVLL